jgi:RES domain-containing protein
MRAVYAALDPATAILEVAVHKTFETLDATPHMLTWARIADLKRVRVVQAESLPNPNWLKPGEPSAGQQDFGEELLRSHAFVLLPSVVSSHNWNVIFDPARAAGLYDRVSQERFALDARLHPPATA